MTEKDIEEKILQYETFLNDTLKSDLRKLHNERDKVFEEQAEFLALKNSIIAIQAAGLKEGEPLKTKMDLGCNFYAQAEVPNPQMIFVSVGLGFFAELTLDEALAFIEKKDKQLAGKAEAFTKDSIKAKANIKLVVGGLQELQKISLEEGRKPQRDIFA